MKPITLIIALLLAGCDFEKYRQAENAKDIEAMQQTLALCPNGGDIKAKVSSGYISHIEVRCRP